MSKYKSMDPNLSDKEWTKRMKEYLRSPKHKANLRKDLEKLAAHIKGLQNG